MKKLFVAASAAALAISTQAGAATYTPIGVQTNVSVATVLSGGWSQCFVGTYGTPIGNSSALPLAGCDTSGDLMLAARLTGSDTLLLLAQAPTADVLFDVGNGNTTHNANGVEWYYSENYSWGFAQGGDTVARNQCDTNGGNGQFRLCWHTIAGVGGWRAGTATNLNDSQAYERLIFSSAGSGAVPEPATWAMLILGMGIVGAGMRKRQASARYTFA